MPKLIIRIFILFICICNLIFILLSVSEIKSCESKFDFKKSSSKISVNTKLLEKDIQERLYILDIGGGGEYRPEYKNASKYNKLRGIVIQKVTLDQNVMSINESQTLTVYLQNYSGRQTNSKVYLNSFDFDISPSSNVQFFEISTNEIKEIKWIIKPKTVGKRSLLVNCGIYQNINNESLSIPVEVVENPAANSDKRFAELENKIEIYKAQNEKNLIDLHYKFYIATGITSFLLVILLGSFINDYLSLRKQRQFSKEAN